MFEIRFFRDKNDRSEIVDYLDELKEKAETNKDARINREKILTYLSALSQYGTRIGSPIVKHIDGEIWELRPLKNRIFFFYWKEDTFVMLHYFIKKSRKTPTNEINKARANLKDFLERSEQNEKN